MVIARFPVLDFPPLWWLFLVSHLLILAIGFLLYSGSEIFLLLVLLLRVSAVEANRHYRALTNAPDDLCWTGVDWVMSESSQGKEPQFLQLQPESWLTRYACLLIFRCGEQTRAWLFVRRQLGAKAWSRLMSLCNMQLTRLRNADLRDQS